VHGVCAVWAAFGEHDAGALLGVVWAAGRGRGVAFLLSGGLRVGCAGVAEDVAADAGAAVVDGAGASGVERCGVAASAAGGLAG
jgi:hypothetical protein